MSQEHPALHRWEGAELIRYNGTWYDGTWVGMGGTRNIFENLNGSMCVMWGQEWLKGNT